MSRPRARLEAEETLVAAGLEEPRRLLVDEDGSLLVSDWGTSHQIKVFSPQGRFQRAIGRPGGPQLGLYHEQRMSHPCGAAFDSKGRLWVAEAESYPKRLSLWNRDGSFVRAWYGPPKYGGGGAIDPNDQSRLFYAEYEKGGGLEFALDWHRGESKVSAVYWRPEMFAETIPGPAPERATIVAGRTYLTNCYNGQLRYNQDRGIGIWRLDPDHIAPGCGRRQRRRLEQQCLGLADEASASHQWAVGGQGSGANHVCLVRSQRRPRGHAR